MKHLFIGIDPGKSGDAILIARYNLEMYALKN